jgi:AraC-like DNA-binding protein
VEVRWRGEEETFGALHDSVAIAALVTFLRQQLAVSLAPARVTFVFPRPSESATAAAYARFFGCPVEFGDTHTRVRFPTSYLSVPMAHSDSALRALLDQQAQALLLALPDSDRFDRALQEVMVKLLPDANATLPRAAREMRVSVRTLQRRLDARGLTWQQLLDRTREQLARQYLADRALSLADIALLLGFSEQSAFTRAFRRWTGETPRRVRASLRRQR